MIEQLFGRFRRITSGQAYLAEIDGMRFLSLFLVILFHIRGYFLEKTTIHFADDPDRFYWMNRFFINADRSVPLFFAISGFILGVPFANYYLRGGKKISLKMYYLRRLTRLEPPYFIVMTCIFIAQIALGNYTFRELLPSLLASLIYSHDLIYHHTPLVTVVAWTLEVEIQFYLIAPYVFRIFTLPTVARRCLLAGLIAGFVVLQFALPPTFVSIYAYAQHFLAGILVADLYVTGYGAGFLKKPLAALCAPALILAMFLMPRWEEGLDWHLIGLAIAFPFMIALLYIIILRNEAVKRVFSYKFIPVIGGMCYTIYLLHYTVISMLGRLLVRVHLTRYYLPNLLLQFVLQIIPILLISCVFYLYVERPFMSRKWIDKLMKKDKITAPQA